MSLQRYREKRRFGDTPEPEGKAASGGRLHFVIQKHWATRLHYDFRLELDGVLKSWAIPRDPPVQVGERRLAIMVEDHPLEYRAFEGVIPEGNYGAGRVIIWDEGTYRVKGAADRADSERLLREGLEAGSVTLELAGEELEGEFVLARIRGRNDHWLLIRRTERAVREQVAGGAAEVGAVPEPEELSWSEEVARRRAGLEEVPSIDLEGAVHGPMPEAVEPMRVTLVDKPFDKKGWLFELKLDGYRTIARVENGKVTLLSRRRNVLNDRFPAVVETLRRLHCNVILDGEIVALDERGRSDYQLLQNYLRTAPERLVYCVYDIIYLNGYDLRSVPLVKRKRILGVILPRTDNVLVSEYVEEGGLSLYKVARENGVEGIVAKDGQSPYRAGVRGDEWLKIKTVHRQEAVIGGFTAPKGAREHIGALVLGVYENDRLVPIGDAGSGFSGAELAELRRRFRGLERASPAFSPVPVEEPTVVWLEPRLVCEVQFAGWTRDGCMRQPVYLGLREDKEPREVRREQPLPAREIAAKSRAAVEPLYEDIPIGPVTVRVTHPDKLYWPEEGISKRELIDYYRSVSSFILPYLKDRPLALNRFPDGIFGKSFRQQNVTFRTPHWVRTARIALQGEQESRYFLCQDEASLAYLVNLGCIEFNPWLSRLGNLDKPDYLVIDFDPLNISFDSVIDAVLAAREVLDEAGAEGWCKTSGATGMHLCVPLGGRYGYAQAEEFAKLLCLLTHHKVSGITSLRREPRAREGFVYLDFLQNVRAHTVAAPYAVRPVPGACVSTPLRWEEVRSGLDPRSFTLRSVPRRFDEVGDLWGEVLQEGIDMESCIGRLEEKYRDVAEKTPVLQ